MDLVQIRPNRQGEVVGVVRLGKARLSNSVCLYVRERVRACIRACMHACVRACVVCERVSRTHTAQDVRARVRVRVRVFSCMHACLACMHTTQCTNPPCATSIFHGYHRASTHAPRLPNVCLASLTEMQSGPGWSARCRGICCSWGNPPGTIGGPPACARVCLSTRTSRPCGRVLSRMGAGRRRACSMGVIVFGLLGFPRLFGFLGPPSPTLSSPSSPSACVLV